MSSDPLGGVFKVFLSHWWQMGSWPLRLTPRDLTANRHFVIGGSGFPGWSGSCSGLPEGVKTPVGIGYLHGCLEAGCSRTMELGWADSRLLKPELFDNDPQAQSHLWQVFAFMSASSSHASYSCYTEQWKVGLLPCGHAAEIAFLGSLQGLESRFCLFHTSPRVVSNRPRRTIDDHRFQRQMGLSGSRSF